MPSERHTDAPEPPGTARGKLVSLSRHAADGMYQERPPLAIEDVLDALRAPDSDTGRDALRHMGGRTVIVRYTEYEDEIHVRSISATRRRLPP